MMGAIIGDIVGSIYEFHNIKTKEFPFFGKKCFFTDDTVMTIAVKNALGTYKRTKDLELFKTELVHEMKRLGRLFPDRGYGGRFKEWLASADSKPYNSFGNGSAMRVSNCGLVATSLEEALALAKASAEVTHNHPEGIKGAEATAAAVFLAKDGWGKERIKKYIQGEFYDIDFTLDEIRESYRFDETCQGSVPQALECFFEGDSYEDVIRNAISIGGDCDTTAAIAGGIADAYYGVPEEIATEAVVFLKEIIGEINED